MGVGLPVSLLFVMLVIGTQIAFRIFYLYVTDNENAEINVFYKNVPYILYAISIVVYSKIYYYVAKILVDKENHRTESKYESSLIQKVYIFNFVNMYISNFVFAFWAKSFSKLAQNLATFLVAKQVLVNVVEWLKLSLLVKKKITKISKQYDDLIAQSTSPMEKQMLKMQKSIEEQNMMMPHQKETIMNSYLEGIVQLGFVCLFANCLTVAAIFCVITNMIEIRIKLS